MSTLAKAMFTAPQFMLLSTATARSRILHSLEISSIYGEGINETGQVTVRSVLNYKLFEHGFLYGEGKMTHLGTLGGDFSSGNSINDLGQVVGYSYTFSNESQHAFLYSKGQMTDLNAFINPALGITLRDANGINDNGQIVANSGSRAYLLTPLATTPIPEPSTLALFGASLL